MEVELALGHQHRNHGVTKKGKKRECLFKSGVKYEESDRIIVVVVRIVFLERVHTCSIVVNAGKYPHLVVAVEGVTINSPHSELLVNFGAVPVGQTAERWIEILNMSQV